MNERLTAQVLVSALVRRAQGDGGFAVIVRRGDMISGTILVQTLEKGKETGLFERISDYAGGYRLVPCGPPDGDREAIASYIARRTRSDPDLWIVELDIAEAERFAAETIC